MRKSCYGLTVFAMRNNAQNLLPNLLVQVVQLTFSEEQFLGSL